MGKHFPDGVESMRTRMTDNAILALKEVSAVAADCGVVLGVEVVNRFESPLVNTAAEALYVAESVGREGLGILLDTFRMNIEDQNLGDAIRAAGKHLVHFQACENNRMVPGRGHVNWDEVLQALREVGYAGPLVMEALPGPYGTVASRLDIWRTLSDDVDAELKEAARFLREKQEEAQYGV